MQIKCTLGHMAQDYFGPHAKAFAAWTSASHVEVVSSNNDQQSGGGPEPKPKTP